MNAILTPRHCGFTVVEVLLALTISAILMAAVATAMYAGAFNMTTNSDFTQATQTARNAVQAISTAVRTSYTCDVDAGATAPCTLAGKNVIYVTQFSSSGGAGAKVAYLYDSGNQMLLLDTAPVNSPIDSTTLPGIRTRMAGTNPTVFLLANNVASCSFNGTYDQRKYDVMAEPLLRLVNVDIKLRISIDDIAGGAAMDLAESVVPRTSYAQ